MIWTWDGREFGSLRMCWAWLLWAQATAMAPISPWITTSMFRYPARALAPVDGQYDVRVTEELSEVSYLDQVLLYRRGPSRRHRDLHQREVQGAAISRSSGCSV